jgi:hypothetical protein
MIILSAVSFVTCVEAGRQKKRETDRKTDKYGM